MFKKKGALFTLCIVLIFTLVVAAGCGQDSVEQDASEGNENEGLNIVTSLSILSDLVENILGDRGTVEFLIPIGEEPEDYELLPSDMQKISDADLFILNGFHLEEGIEANIGNVSDTKIIHAIDGVTPIPLVGEDTPDPHAWLDIQLIADYYVENILTALIELDPEGEEHYRENAAAYKVELQKLDAWIKEQVQQIPEKNRIIVISENAMKYYGEAYGFHTEGIWELNSHEEGTPQQISRIVELAIEKELPALFVETTVDSRYMNTVSNEADIPIAGELYTDAVGLPGSGAETYIDMMKHNTDTLLKGLSK
ncbi:iron/zinc/copper transport system substrate-binding protein [Desulfitispora alkaliphila]|uniref:metal ABC transporter solute-binding protein, Zn/Mn family n=1 Tax=Desulfitispora alkaliphila TaxID=622674 RepID=UPI003D218422